MLSLHKYSSNNHHVAKAPDANSFSFFNFCCFLCSCTVTVAVCQLLLVLGQSHLLLSSMSNIHSVLLWLIKMFLFVLLPIIIKIDNFVLLKCVSFCYRLFIILFCHICVSWPNMAFINIRIVHLPPLRKTVLPPSPNDQAHLLFSLHRDHTTVVLFCLFLTFKAHGTGMLNVL